MRTGSEVKHVFENLTGIVVHRRAPLCRGRNHNIPNGRDGARPSGIESRSKLQYLALFAIALGLALSLPAAEPGKYDQATLEKAVARGVDFLISQSQTNGAISTTPPPNQPHAKALTGLSIMALTAVGHRPTDDTPAGHTLRKALDYILDPKRQSTSKENPGYYGEGDDSRMYGHGIVTLMLAEMVGMGVDARQDELIRDHCQQAIDLIVRSQKVKKNETFKGGWRYTPLATDADLSVTVWQVMALRAAKNAGLTVPKTTIDDAVAYIKRSYNSRRNSDGRIVDLASAFSYQPGGGPAYSTASEGLLALQVCGEYDAPELTGTVEWLRLNKLKNTGISYFYYGTYYYAQGMYQRGGATADEARQLVENLLLHEQKENGRWQGQGGETSPVYATAMAILSLSVRHHFMPIYQR